MIYILTLRYIRPREDVQAHLGTHQQWLAQQIRAGHILAAGPNEDHSGGIVLASCEDRDALDRMVEEDSFIVHRVAEVSVQGFEPAVRAPALRAEWAPHAAVVPA